MILTLEELKELAPDLTGTDAQLTFQLKAAEQAIKGATNNDFNRYKGVDGEIQWPDDIKVGCIEMLRYKASESARKAAQGIASETISRHSVSYGSATAAETEAGYPYALMKFLDPYRRARF